jgi:hypothetical protein
MSFCYVVRMIFFSSLLARIAGWPVDIDIDIISLALFRFPPSLHKLYTCLSILHDYVFSSTVQCYYSQRRCRIRNDPSEIVSQGFRILYPFSVHFLATHIVLATALYLKNCIVVFLKTHPTWLPSSNMRLLLPNNVPRCPVLPSQTVSSVL